MRGKKSYRDGAHPSRVGEIVEAITIGNAEWRELEKVLGNLDESSRDDIAEYCSILQGISREGRASAADVRITLDGIANERDSVTVIEAFKNCDDKSAAMIDLFLYRLDGPDFFKTLPTLPANRQATKIRAAACLASKDFNPSRGPSIQGWQRMAAEYAIQLARWRGVSTAAHAFNDDPSNACQVVALLLTLLGIINPVDSAQSVSWCVRLIGEINAQPA